MNGQVGAVLVTYHPNPDEFYKVLKAALPEVDCLVVVNNGDTPINLDACGVDSIPGHRVEVIENGSNLGIAFAQNKGIARLIESGCRYVLFLDHDSLIPTGMVKGLRDALHDLKAKDNGVVAVGPAYFNARLDKNAPFVRFGWFKLIYTEASADLPYVPVDFLISSGTLMTIDALHQVGMMDDGLFIDYVDTEWCIRAASKGYKLYGCSRIGMHHSLGDEPVEFLNKKLPNHSPLRHYYIVRNAIALVRRSYVPIKCRLIIMLSMIKTFIFYSVAPSNRWDHLNMMCQGLYDGLIKKSGRYDR